MHVRYALGLMDQFSFLMRLLIASTNLIRTVGLLSSGAPGDLRPDSFISRAVLFNTRRAGLLSSIWAMTVSKCLLRTVNSSECSPWARFTHRLTHRWLLSSERLARTNRYPQPPSKPR